MKEKTDPSIFQLLDDLSKTCKYFLDQMVKEAKSMFTLEK